MVEELRDFNLSTVSCGRHHTGFLTVGGTLYMSGRSSSGELGYGRKEYSRIPVRTLGIGERIIQVSCGESHTLCLDECGRIWAWGSNKEGQLGTGDKESQTYPIMLPSLSGQTMMSVQCGHHSASISNQGELFIWGTGVFGQYLLPHLVPSINVAVNEVNVGGAFGVALDNRGIIWCWGSNNKGELGVGDYESRSAPYPLINLHESRIAEVACGGEFAIAIVKRDPQQRRGSKLLTLKPNTLIHHKPAESMLDSQFIPPTYNISSPERTRAPKPQGGKIMHQSAGRGVKGVGDKVNYEEKYVEKEANREPQMYRPINTDSSLLSSEASSIPIGLTQNFIGGGGSIPENSLSRVILNSSKDILHMFGSMDETHDPTLNKVTYIYICYLAIPYIPERARVFGRSFGGHQIGQPACRY